MQATEKLVFCGFSDTANVGDFALFKANKQIFGNVLLEESAIPHETDHVELMNLFGGGTYFPYGLRYKYKRRKHNFALGLGAHEPEKGRYGLLTRLAISRWKFHYLGVRGYRTQEVLKRHNIKSVVTGDTAMAILPPGNTQNTKTMIGVSLVGESMARIGSLEKVSNSMETTCRRLLADGLDIRLFAFCKTDMPQTQVLQERLSAYGHVEIVDFWASPINRDLVKFLAEMETCAAFISERLHASVLSAVVNRPFVPISYKPKCRDFVDSLRIGDLSCVDPVEIDSEVLHERVLRLTDDISMKQQLKENVKSFRERIEEAGAEILETASRMVGKKKVKS
jgi:polysaccharide pyruvyl transferase WcaK-like protein